MKLYCTCDVIFRSCFEKFKYKFEACGPMLGGSVYV